MALSWAASIGSIFGHSFFTIYLLSLTVGRVLNKTNIVHCTLSDTFPGAHFNAKIYYRVLLRMISMRECRWQPCLIQNFIYFCLNSSVFCYYYRTFAYEDCAFSKMCIVLSLLFLYNRAIVCLVFAAVYFSKLAVY